MQVMARCVRCGRIAPAQVFEVNEYEYSGYGITEPKDWLTIEFCGEPCAPSDWKQRHGPWPQTSPVIGHVNSVLETAYGLDVTFIADKVFPVIPIDKPGKSFVFKYRKDKP